MCLRTLMRATYYPRSQLPATLRIKAHLQQPGCFCTHNLSLDLPFFDPSPKFTWKMNTRLRYIQWLINSYCKFNGIFYLYLLLQYQLLDILIFLIDIYLHISVFNRTCIFQVWTTLSQAPSFPHLPCLAANEWYWLPDRWQVDPDTWFWPSSTCSLAWSIATQWLCTLPELLTSFLLSDHFLLCILLLTFAYIYISISNVTQAYRRELTHLCNLDLTFKDFTIQGSFSYHGTLLQPHYINEAKSEPMFPTVYSTKLEKSDYAHYRLIN